MLKYCRSTDLLRNTVDLDHDVLNYNPFIFIKEDFGLETKILYNINCCWRKVVRCMFLSFGKFHHYSKYCVLT